MSTKNIMFVLNTLCVTYFVAHRLRCLKLRYG